jgi:hypothetical protein
MSTPSGSIVKVTGVKNQGKTATVLVRGSNRLVIDEVSFYIYSLFVPLESFLLGLCYMPFACSVLSFSFCSLAQSCPLPQAERSVHDALCVIRSLVKLKYASQSLRTTRNLISLR